MCGESPFQPGEGLLLVAKSRMEYREGYRVLVGLW